MSKVVVKIPALRFVQGTKTFYQTVWSGDELRTKAKAPWYDPATDTGYQRKPKQTRIVAAAKYLANGGNFPTAVLINCREPLQFEVETNFGIFDFGMLSIPAGAKLNLVDGQTRQLGIEYGVQELGLQELANFGIPIVLSNNPDEFSEMENFVDVNSKQKSVPTDLTDRLIVKRLHEKSSQEQLIRSGQIGVLRNWKAVEVARLLNDRQNSPWHGLIKPPNASESVSDASFVSERSMSQSLREVIRRMDTLSVEEITNIVSNFWTAVMKKCSKAATDKENYPYLWNTTGVYTMHYLLPVVYERAAGDTSVNKFAEILYGIDSLEDNFWIKDGDLKGMGGIGGFKKIADGLIAEVIGS